MHKKVVLIGTGIGGQSYIHPQARAEAEQAQCIIGAKRLTDAFAADGKAVLQSVSPTEIADFVQHSAYTHFGVMLSGDPGFYSLANALRKALPQEVETQTVPAVGSLQYICAKVGKSWQEVHTLSLHGRENPAEAVVMHNKETFLLTGGSNGVAQVCRRLTDAGMGKLQAWVGENLSYSNELLTLGTLAVLAEGSFAPLSVLLVQNPQPVLPQNIPDEAFVRGDVPMTKSEVRTLSLAKLNLKPDSVLVDVGAGTGSVAVQAALQLTKGSVYAVERNTKAVELIQSNRKKFCAYNLYVIQGAAPQALEQLPQADAAFIGGSGGNLGEIVDTLLANNPYMNIVMNAITLESLSEAMLCIKTRHFLETEVACVTIAKAKVAEDYHLMMGQNPVYIISMKGGGQ